MRDYKIDVQFNNDESIDKDAYLWRYVDLHKFLSFIFTKSLHLTRLDKFEDKKEGITLSHLFFQNIKKKLDNHPIFDSIREIMSVDTLGNEMNQIDDELKTIQEFNFANCWVLGGNESESVAMWNLYSSPNSLAIKIKFSEFKKLISEKGVGNHDTDLQIMCGPVRYIDFQKSDLNPAKVKEELSDSVFVKDVSFEHEREYRIIAKEKVREKPEIKYKPNMNKKNIGRLHNERWNYTGIELELLDFKEYNFEIVHHPKSQDWAKKNIESIMQLSNIGFKVSESKLELK